MLRVQVGKIYQQYISKAERGILIGDEQMLKFTKLLKSRFNAVKDNTKARLRTGQPTKSRKPRDNQEKSTETEKMLDRKYLRLKYFSYMSN